MQKTIRDLRDEAKLTQDEMAQTMGISKSYYSLLERGLRGMSLENAKKISELLNHPLEDIFHAYSVCKMSLTNEQPTGTTG